MTPFNIGLLGTPHMRIPKVDPDLCDVVMWREGNTYYCMHVGLRAVSTIADVAAFIADFPRSLKLCIVNDSTGQVVPIKPVAN